MGEEEGREDDRLRGSYDDGLSPDQDDDEQRDAWAAVSNSRAKTPGSAREQRLVDFGTGKHSGAPRKSVACLFVCFKSRESGGVCASRGSARNARR
eukprot:1007395-Prorocentrum_minimum.AAC.1